MFFQSFPPFKIFRAILANSDKFLTASRTGPVAFQLHYPVLYFALDTVGGNAIVADASDAVAVDVVVPVAGGINASFSATASSTKSCFPVIFYGYNFSDCAFPTGNYDCWCIFDSIGFTFFTYFPLF